MVSRTPISMASGDFNCDGRDDIAVTSSSNSAYIFTNSEIGFYINTPPSSSFPLAGTGNQVRSADLNDDGLTDLLISYSGRPEIALFLSKGASGFVNPINMTTGGPANGSFAGDVNGDGRDDFIASSSASSAISYWLQHNLVPKADRWLSTLTLTEGNSIRYDASNSTDSISDRDSLQYYWFFEQGGTSTLKSGQYLFAKSGTYDGYLRVTDRGGLTNFTYFQVVVADIAPVASFTFVPDNGPENNTVWFNDTSIHYDAITWRWDFGHGNYAYTQNTTYKYAQDGTYRVWLNITDTDGKFDNASQYVHVADLSPTAGIRVSASAIDENDTVSFYDDSYSSPDTITSYSWNFDDGSQPDPSEDAIHWFPIKGAYNVTLTITDSDGDQAVANVTIVVRDTPPTASFTPSKLNPVEGETIILTDMSYSYDGVSSLFWELGDGRTFITKNVTCSYMDSGTYLVNLTVTDLDGVVSKTSRTIVVQPTSPTVDEIIADGGKITFNMDEQISFQISAQQAPRVPITKFAWDFDYDAVRVFVEASGISINQTSWSYHASKQYVVCVRVYDSKTIRTPSTSGFLPWWSRT